MRVAGETVCEIGRGVLALVGVERGDAEREATRLAERTLGYRIFPDAEGKMNRSLADIGGGLLLVPQFTLAADTSKGNRPSFSDAADPATGRDLFDALVRDVSRLCPRVATGQFGANMAVSLVNQGPVTLLLQV